MLELEDNPRVHLGANSPPPIESHRLHIEELMAEAQSWLDGQPITTQAQADDVGRLKGMLREARKGADEQRAIEKKPHDEAGKAVQAAWKPLIERCEQAEKVAQRALTPFLEAQEAEKRREAEEARLAAQRAQEEALAARRAATAGTDLAAQEAAEKLTKEAAQAERAATKADKAKPSAAGMGRAVGLRTIYRPELTDARAALNHYAVARRDELRAWLLDQAQRDVRAGTRSIPGITINEEKVAQ